MIDAKKRDAILQWLACYKHKLDGLSDLEDGSVFLKLLSTVDGTIDQENVCANERLRIIEDCLCAMHDCLPARFLARASTSQKGEKQLELATTAVLILSALFVRAASPSCQQSVAPMMSLEPQVQEEIKELLQIVTTSQDVLVDLREHLRVSSDEESPVTVKRRHRKRKSQSFTFSPTRSKTPKKRVLTSPEHPSYSAAMQKKEQQIRQLRKQLSEEEAKTMDLQQEVAGLKDCTEKKEREIARLKAVIHQLTSDLDAGTNAENETERLKSEVDVLKCSLQSLQTIREDYDDVISENASLNKKLEELGEAKRQVKQLKASVADARAERSTFEDKLTDANHKIALLEEAVVEKNKEVEAYRDFFNSKGASIQSPGTPITSPQRVSCFAELCQVELEQTKEQLEEMTRIKGRLEKDILELREKEAKGDTEISMLRETVAHLESSVETLGNDLSESTKQLKTLSGTLACTKEAEEQLRCALHDREQRINELNEELAKASSTLRDVSHCKGVLEERLSEREAAIVELNASTERLRRENDCLRVKSAELAKEADQKAAQLLQFETMILQQKELICQFEESSQSWDEARRVLESDNVTLMRDLEGSLERCAAEEMKVSRLESNIGELHKTVDELKEMLKNAMEENTALKQDLKDYGLQAYRLENAERERDKLSSELNQLNTDLKKATLQQTQLTRHLEESTRSWDEARTLLENNNSSLMRDLEESAKQYASEKTKVSSLESSVEQLHKAMEELEETLKRAMDENTALKRDLEDRRGLLDQFRSMERERDKASFELRLLNEKNQTVTESCSDLRRQNDSLRHELEEASRMLGCTMNENDALKQKVHSLNESLAHLTVERNSLQLTVDELGAQKSVLESNISNLMQEICDLRSQSQESARVTEERVALLTSAKDNATEELEKLHRVSRKLENRLKGLKAERDGLRSEVCAAKTEKLAVQESLDKVEGQHQSLCDRYSDLECKLNRLQESYHRSEEEYFKCVEEKEKNKDELKSVIDELSQELAERTTKLQEKISKCDELEELLGVRALEVEHLACKKSDAEKKCAVAKKKAKMMEMLEPLIAEMVTMAQGLMGMRPESKEDGCNELDVETNLRLVHSAIIAATTIKARSDAQKKKEKNVIHKMEEEFKAIQSEVDAKMKKVEKQRDHWKLRHEELRSCFGNREKEFSKLTSEMKKTIMSNNADIQKLKTELSEQCAKIKTLETERDRLVLENRQLKAEAKYCEQQMRDMLERKKGSTTASSKSCNRTRGFKVSTLQSGPKQDSPHPHDASLSHTLNSNIFSENRFACDEEQDVFFETGLTDLQPVETDFFGRYSELHRRNSMVPAHLKSIYPVETQASIIPATPLKEATFIAPDLCNENTKRKRSTVSSGSRSSSSSVKNPTPETPQKKSTKGKGTPSSLRKLIKRRFHRD